jgi:hypothetical protein
MADAGAEIRLHPADLPLLLREQFEVLDKCRPAGATDVELAELVADLLRVREW